MKRKRNGNSAVAERRAPDEGEASRAKSCSQGKSMCAV